MQQADFIYIHCYPLGQILHKSKADFSHLALFNAYQKAQIYQLRNQHLSQYLQREISAQHIQHSVYGKPYLADQALAFNHSHSQQHYALALSQHVLDLGVDIEDLSRKVRFEALAKHAFHADELAQWYRLNQDKHYWFQVWTAKEAILKASGLGIRLNLNELNTQCLPEQHRAQCYHAKIGYFAVQHFNLPEAMLSVAWRIEKESCIECIPKMILVQH